MATDNTPRRKDTLAHAMERSTIDTIQRLISRLEDYPTVAKRYEFAKA